MSSATALIVMKKQDATNKSWSGTNTKGLSTDVTNSANKFTTRHGPTEVEEEIYTILIEIVSIIVHLYPCQHLQCVC